MLNETTMATFNEVASNSVIGEMSLHPLIQKLVDKAREREAEFKYASFAWALEQLYRGRKVRRLYEDLAGGRIHIKKGPVITPLRSPGGDDLIGFLKPTHRGLEIWKPDEDDMQATGWALA